MFTIHILDFQYCPKCNIWFLDEHLCKTFEYLNTWDQFLEAFEDTSNENLLDE